MITLHTTVEIIDALGGNEKAAEILSTNGKAVSNWRYSKKFPANTYIVLRRALFERGFDAPDHLWAMKTPTVLRRRKTA